MYVEFDSYTGVAGDRHASILLPGTLVLSGGPIVRLAVRAETWPLLRTFTISRGARSAAEVVVAEVRDGEYLGRGECVPYPRYGESVEGVIAAIEELADPLSQGLTRADLQPLLPAGAARNALDCALWDLDAKRSAVRAWELVGMPEPEPALCTYTIALGPPAEMGVAAAEHAERPLLKVKLGGDEDRERIAAVRRAAPNARLIVDANEGWRSDRLAALLSVMADHGVELVEQPVAAADDAILADIPHAVPVCADESCHTSEDIATLTDRYDLVNIKLDKAGGLTEALRMHAAAQQAGMGIMVGTMMGTSLLMAPALLLTHGAAFVDLDGPLWLARDRDPPMRFDGGNICPPDSVLWG